MELASQVGAFEKRGIGVAAVIHEPVEALRAFAAKHGISFPLLADPDSTVIKRFGLVDPEFKSDELTDVPYAGSFLLDAQGVVLEKFFEDATEYRRTAGSILVRFGESGPGADTRQTDHFTVRSSASNAELMPGQRFTLALDFEMQEHHHAYAPGAEGYRPLALRLDADPLFVFHEPQRPEPRPYFFAPLKETVPVYEGRFRMLEDVTVDFRQALSRFGDAPSYTTAVTGRVDYQVCSDRVCYPPGSLPLRWPVTIRRWVK